MFNFCVFCGRVCNEPVLSFFEEALAVTKFNLTLRVLDVDAGWIKVTCYGRIAVLAAKHVHRGDRVAVTGLITVTNWQAADGKWCSDAKVTAIDLELVQGAEHAWWIKPL